MPVRRDSRGVWRYRKVLRLPDGTKRRISGTPAVNKKWAAEKAEETEILRILDEVARPKRQKEVPTFGDWFTGRYMREWCEAQHNKPSTVVEKQSIFDHHLRDVLGPLKLDAIDVGVIQTLKAAMNGRANRYKRPLALKTRNNVLAVVSKALNYAEEVGLIDKAPRIRPYRFERPEIDCWDFEEWGRLVEGARKEGSSLFIATLLAGDGGLRLGEVLGLRWEDVDFVGGRITVARQIRKGVEGSPKGGRRRSVPLTGTLMSALKALPQVRTGRVVCGAEGVPIAEAMLKHGIYKVCRLAGLPPRSWHSLRHTFATHAARFGVNPWRLQAWLGHTTINMTMRYVHHVEEHRRPIPEEILSAGSAVLDPDDRVLAMLGARLGASGRGNGVATGARSLTVI